MKHTTTKQVEYGTIAKLEIDFITELEQQKQRKPRNRNAIMRVNTALAYLRTLPRINRLGIRLTRNGSKNVGDLVECVIKSQLNGGKVVDYSSPFEKDLDKMSYNEIKAFTCYNSYPNGWHDISKISGVLIALPDKKVYYLKKQIVIDSVGRMKKSRRNGMQLTLGLVKKLIVENNLKPHYITKKLNKA
jgi:hypothetical protein